MINFVGLIPNQVNDLEMKITRYIFDRFVPDSLLILPTASSDGIYEHNKRLAIRRVASTKNFLLNFSMDSRA